MPVLNSRAITLSFLAIFFFAHGCDGVLGDPKVEILTTQMNGTVHFAFSMQDRRLWSKTSIPIKVAGLTIVDEDKNTILWQVEAPNVDLGANSIGYGVTPEGFSQLIPQHASPPPPLEVGKKYTILISPPGDTSFTYNGGTK
jgi:hypothetical protein